MSGINNNSQTLDSKGLKTFAEVAFGLPAGTKLQFPFIPTNGIHKSLDETNTNLNSSSNGIVTEVAKILAKKGIEAGKINGKLVVYHNSTNPDDFYSFEIGKEGSLHSVTGGKYMGDISNGAEKVTDILPFYELTPEGIAQRIAVNFSYSKN